MSSAKNKKINILVVGDFLAPIHEIAIADALESLGHNVSRFATSDYFRANNIFSEIYKKIQNKFNYGPLIDKLNKDLILKSQAISTNLVFIYRGTKIKKETVLILKSRGALVFGYSNDDPFSSKYPFYVWKTYLESVPEYDHIFYYRDKNKQDYKNISFERVSLLRSYYIKKLNFPIISAEKNKYTCDVSFVGHFEEDGRDEYIKAIIDQGYNFQLHGPEWKSSKYFQLFTTLGDINPVGKDYNLAINSTKISLVFLSRLNSDTYTRRCFEIPAAGTFMLSEYSEDLAGLFAPGKEVEYFKNKEEMLEKIKYYLAHQEEREKIAAAGHARVLRDGHEVSDRARQIISVYEKYNNENIAHNS